MQNRKQIDENIQLTDSLKGLATAYEEISVSKMQQARGKVLYSREYLKELADVFASVKASYQSEIQKLIKSKKDFAGHTTYSTLAKNGKSIVILISSNSKLSGDIGRKVFKYFIDKVEKQKSDIYIVGKVGREMYDQSGNPKPYQYIDMPEGQSAETGLKTVLEALNKYETVTVFYGQFINVLNQNPIESNVTGNQSLQSANDALPKTHFYFEPSLETILAIFENQIFSSLFKQTLHESELSHVASRITQMENALQNIQVSQKKLFNAKRIAKKREEARKQMQRLKGRLLWK